MAYQLKYFLEYKSLKVGSTDTYRLELWQNTTIVLTAEEIKGWRSPFSLEMPTLNHKFQVVRGRGCIINLLSDTDMKFFEGLKHIDPQEFKYIHKLNSTVIGVGYLNSDMYSEPYDQSQNYIISTTGNDGFSLMDRFRFLQSDETRYIGLKSEWELIQICLNKVGLSYNDIRIKLSTTFADFSGDTDSTILHESFVNCANFYDEDGLGMTMREVIDSILAPYGAFIIQDSGSIYITDIHSLAGGGSILFQKFNATTYAYIDNVSVVIEKDVYDVGYFGTGHSIVRDGGTNTQRVIYSPYPQKNIINKSIITPDEFSVVPEIFTEKESSNGYRYMARTLVGNNVWQNIPMTQAIFEESYGELTEFGTVKYTDRNTHMILPMSSYNLTLMKTEFNNTVFSIKRATIYGNYGKYQAWQQVHYSYTNGASILLTGQIFINTKENPYDEYEVPVNKITGHKINFSIKIGNYYYDQSAEIWSTTPSNDNYILTTKNGEDIANTWVDIGENGGGLLIPINVDDTELLEGEMLFEIKSNTEIRYDDRFLFSPNNSILKQTWMSGLIIQFVNIDGTEISDSDYIYTGYLNKLFVNEGKEITLTTGTAVGYTDLARIMKFNSGQYSNIDLWTRASQTYKIEELLLNSLCSNYRNNFVTLHSIKLKNEFSLINVFTDTTFLEDNPILMIKSSVIDYENYTHEVTLVEISEDELTIVKE